MYKLILTFSVLLLGVATMYVGIRKRDGGIRGGFYTFISPLTKFLVERRVNPNIITSTGLFFSIVAAIIFITGDLFLAGFMMFLAGICDAIDGTVARTTNTQSKFGMFYDSVLDRYSDLVVFIGISYFYAIKNMWLQFSLVELAIVGSTIVSYTRARAESLGQECKVGVADRAERVAAIIIASIVAGLFELRWIMDVAVGILAVFTNITAVQRIFYVWNHVKKTNVPAEG